MDISVAEYLVYGLLAYSGMLILIISTIKEPPTTRSLSIVRAVYLLPSAICAGILASVGVNININTVTTDNLIRSINTTQTWSETTTQVNVIPLQNPVWSMVHWLIMAVLIWYIIQQVLFLFVKHDQRATGDEG